MLARKGLHSADAQAVMIYQGVKQAGGFAHLE
jgi:hypothetical protein